MEWILEFRGETSEKNDLADHDTALAAGPHSWVEPTTLQLLALRATGYGNHPTAGEAVKGWAINYCRCSLRELTL